MAFGENSGVVSGGIGQGFAQGQQQFSQNYQTGLDRRDKIAEQNRQSAQNALAYKVQQFRDLQPPEPPKDLSNPDLMQQYINDHAQYQTARVALAGDIDSLMNVTTKGVTNPDGTPVNSTTFSNVALGMDRTKAVTTMAQGQAEAQKLNTMLGQYKDLQTQMGQIVEAGGATDNPEYAKLKAQADALTNTIKGSYKTVTGVDFQGQGTDYSALEMAANRRSDADLARKSLQAFADKDPTVAKLLSLANAKGVAFTFNTKLSELGLDNIDGTVGDFFKHMRGDTGFSEALKSGNYEQALAYYASMSPEERNGSKEAQDLSARLAALKTNPDGDATLNAAVNKMNLSGAQLRNITATSVGQEQSNANDWLKRAQNGDPTLTQDFEAYRSEQLSKGKTPDQVDAAWAGLMGVKANAKQSQDDDLALRDQAVQKGSVDNNESLSKMITSGSLFVLNQAGLADSVKKLYPNEQAFSQAIATSKYWYDTGDKSTQADLDTRVANLQHVQQQNEFDKLANPLQLQLMAGQVTEQGITIEGKRLNNEQVQQQIEQNKLTLKYLPHQMQLDYFSKIAEQLGTAGLESPATKTLATELGLTDADLLPYKTLGDFHDWVKSNTKRQQALTEFQQLMQNPVVAAGQGGRLRELSNTLGLNYDSLQTQVNYIATHSKNMDSAQLNSLVTSTWAQKQNVTLSQRESDRQDQQLDLERQKFDWGKYTWQSEFTTNKQHWTATFNREGGQWSAEQELRVRQFNHGASQDDFSNSLQVIKMLQDGKNFDRQMLLSSQQNLTMFAQTARATIDDARGQQKQAESVAADLQEKDTFVKQYVQNGGIYKDKSGEWKWRGQGSPPGTVLQYIEAQNRARDYGNVADAGVKDLTTIRNQLMPRSEGDTAIQSLVASVFGENGAKLVNYPTAKPGQQIRLTPDLRSALTNVGGKNGQLISAALGALDNGVTDRGEALQNQLGRCSQTLRVLYGSVGIPTQKYFGGSAHDTWQMVWKNGIPLNNKQPLSEKSFGLLQPGDLLFQNTPATKNKDGSYSDYDHVATYLGNGLVLQHNSDYSSKTGMRNGNINVLTIQEFTSLFPHGTFAGRIPEMANRPQGSVSSNAPTRPTGRVNTGQASSGGSGGNIDWPRIQLPAGRYRPNLTTVNNSDKLAIPSGRGTFNLITDTGTQRSVVLQFANHASKNIAGWDTLPLEKRRNLIAATLTKQGFQGNIPSAVQDALRK